MEWSTSQHHFKLINGLSDDPGLYCHCLQSGEATLFDLGDLSQMTHKEILKVKRVFVSHTHIDHFYGFEKLLRLNVPHGRCLEVCGPPGIAQNVQGKLRGYIWNLLEPGQIKFIVREISADGGVTSYSLQNDDQFALHPQPAATPDAGPMVRPLPVSPGAFLTNLDDRSRIEAVCVDHGTPSVAYVYQANLRFQTKTSEMERLGLSPGPWIRELQTLAARGAYEETIEAGGISWNVGVLTSEILTYEAPRAFGYLTDLQFNWENLRRLKDLMQDVEELVCESNFMEADFEKAFSKKHLTTKQAALIGAYINAGKLRIFHISKLYRDQISAVVAEAGSYFSTFRAMASEQIEAEVEIEMNRTR